MKGKTASGFKFDIDVEKFKEWDFLDMMADAESDDDSKKLKASVDMVKYIFGKDYAKFIDHVKSHNDGHAPVDAVLAEVSEVMQACTVTKK